MDIVSIFINLSSEYPDILEFVLIVFAAIGILISASGILDIIKLGRRDNGLATPGAHIMWKLIGGTSLIDLSLWARAWSGTLWANSDPMEISEYSSGGVYNEAIMAALGIIVITGWVTIGRAYMMAAKLGTVSIEARGDLAGSIFARLVAGTAMVCVVHIAMAIQESVGSGFFS